jgi:bacillopeptidase F
MLFRALILAALTATVCNAVGEETLSESLRAILPFPGTKRDIIIEMEPLLGDVLTNPAVSSLTGDSQKNRIIGLLKEKTRLSQLPVTTALAKLGLTEKSKSFWIANRIHVKEADVGAIQALSKIPGLNFIIREPVKAKIYSDNEKHHESIIRNTRQANATVIQYGVKIIQAPEVWKLGNIGETIVVGIIDTGVNYNHIALKDNYKNDNASWFDAFGVHKEPYDGNGHGTHV